MGRRCQRSNLPGDFATYVERFALAMTVEVMSRRSAAGLTLPTSTGILSWLTPLAAAGLLVIMLGATVLHLRRMAYAQAVGDSIVLAFAAFVGYQTF